MLCGPFWVPKLLFGWSMKMKWTFGIWPYHLLPEWRLLWGNLKCMPWFTNYQGENQVLWSKAKASRILKGDHNVTEGQMERFWSYPLKGYPSILSSHIETLYANVLTFPEPKWILKPAKEGSQEMYVWEENMKAGNYQKMGRTLRRLPGSSR